MSRIEGRFDTLRAGGRKALIPFVTAGDPEPAATVPLLHALVEAGADLLELGVPFSDPMADGPVIQRASERALAHHVTLHGVLDMVAAFREKDADTPVILMGYLNPIEAFGYAAFAEAAGRAGVDGILTVDAPPEEAEELAGVLGEHGIDPIFLLAPTSDAERIARIGACARGFVYYVSVKGVTGAGGFDLDAIAAKLEKIRAATGLPLGVGFGISDAERAAAVARIADAVIVGSVLVRQIEAHPGDV
ncbi:MAG: tryptophan synthase subunit alpha, partial [Gammaproteobacteria bacterium]|nr:tryptophan synthase subunit alpha [Gammaproteobacteria bacterium]